MSKRFPSNVNSLDQKNNMEESKIDHIRFESIMEEQIAFSFLELLIAALVIYSSYRISKSADSLNWKIITALSGTIGLTAAVNLIGAVSTSFSPAVDALSAPLIGLLFVLSADRFVEKYGVEMRFKSKILFYEAFLFAFLMIAGISNAINYTSLLYLVGFLAVKPAAILFQSATSEGEEAIFYSFTASTVLHLTSYAFKFVHSLNIPALNTGTVHRVLVSAPAIELAGTLMLGYSVYLFYHGVFRDVQAGVIEDSGTEGNQSKVGVSQKLVSETVENLGAIMGKSLAERMAKKALNQAFDTEEDSAEDAASGKDPEEVKKALIEKFTDTMGPVADKKIEEIYEDIGGE